MSAGMSTINKHFAATMDRLKAEDPTAYQAIQKKLQSLKSEAKNWRLQAQDKTPSVDASKEALDDSKEPIK